MCIGSLLTCTWEGLKSIMIVGKRISVCLRKRRDNDISKLHLFEDLTKDKISWRHRTYVLYLENSIVPSSKSCLLLRPLWLSLRSCYYHKIYLAFSIMFWSFFSLTLLSLQAFIEPEDSMIASSFMSMVCRLSSLHKP